MTRGHESLDQSIRRLNPKSPLGKLAIWRESRDEIPHHPLGMRADDFRNLGNPDDSLQRALLTQAASTASRYLWYVEETQGRGAGFNHAVVDGQKIDLMPRDGIGELTRTFDKRILYGLDMGPITRLTLRFVLANTYPAEVPIPGPTLAPGQ